MRVTSNNIISVNNNVVCVSGRQPTMDMLFNSLESLAHKEFAYNIFIFRIFAITSIFPDIISFTNMTLFQIKKIKKIKNRPFIKTSGGKKKAAKKTF